MHRVEQKGSPTQPQGTECRELSDEEEMKQAYACGSCDDYQIISFPHFTVCQE